MSPQKSSAQKSSARKSSAQKKSNGNKTSAQKSDPQQIEKEIEKTRDEMGDTVEAIASKADLKAQAKSKVDAAKNDVRELSSRAKEAAPDSVGAGAEQVAEVARENPVPVSIAGGFLAGIVFDRMLRR